MRGRCRLNRSGHLLDHCHIGLRTLSRPRVRGFAAINRNGNQEMQGEFRVIPVKPNMIASLKVKHIPLEAVGLTLNGFGVFERTPSHFVMTVITSYTLYT